ncbi:MAG: CoA transferase [Burkholderiaceae bacterium]|nr:CoA transferase [Burkholderiaceae bacterium]
MGTGPLRGLVVLDRTRTWARGAGDLLAELGAVVHRPGAGADDPGPGDRATRGALVLLQTFAPTACGDGDARPAGDAATPVPPVRVLLSGLGCELPHSDEAFCDLSLCAAGGLLHPSGFAGEAPTPPAGYPAYRLAALWGAIAALAGVAAWRRHRSPVALEVSALEAVASSLDHVLVQYFALGRVAQRRGGRAWNDASFIVPCADGHLVASVGSQWPMLSEWMAADGMDFGMSGARRGGNAQAPQPDIEAMIGRIARWTRSKTGDELFSTAQALRLPWAPVRSPAQVAACPQLASRGFRGAPYRFRAADGVSTCVAQAPSRAAPDAGDASGGAGLPLRGLRVLDFSWALSGPYATRILADLGADVVKLQSARTGTPPEPGAYDAMWNRGKRSLALDMAAPGAREIALALLARCDVLVENFAPRVLPNWGLDDAALHAANPRLIALHMSAMGADGPWRDHVAFGPGMQALAGLTQLGSSDPARPTGYGHALADHLMGLHAALAVLAAIEQRASDGRGGSIDLSGLESACALSLAPRQPEGAPEGVYPTRGRDGYCALSVRGDGQWQRFGALVGRRWTRAAAFATEQGRRRHARVLDRLVAGWTGGLEAADLRARLQQAGIAASPVQDGAGLFEDPRLRIGGFFVAAPPASAGAAWVDRLPLRFADAPLPRYRAAPRRGEHTVDVLGEWVGLTSDAAAELAQSGVLR